MEALTPKKITTAITIPKMHHGTTDLDFFANERLIIPTSTLYLIPDM